MAGIKISRMLKALKFSGVKNKFLDLGCGVGSFTAVIRKAFPGDCVIGLDVSRKALGLAAERCGRGGFDCGDVLDLPFADVSVDAIGGFDILEHLENVDKTINEIQRALKPEGIAHFHIPCEGQPWTIWWFLWKTGLPGGDLKRKHAGHIQRFTYKGVVNKFHEHGFDVVNVEYSVHIVGQMLDLLQWWATSVRRSLSISDFEESLAPEGSLQGGSSKTVKLLFGIYRLIVRFLEVFSYYETKVFKKIGLGMAVDITLKKRSHLL
jgi:ubiquinone/menaquinone biosynthesis C-methylase UbiE